MKDNFDKAYNKLVQKYNVQGYLTEDDFITITEKFDMENVVKKLDNKTLIVIANRFETIKDVDKIYVLSDGIIQEEGKYNELLDKNGYFTKLYKSAK